MNKYSKDFRKAMTKIIGKNWKFDCYTYNDYHFIDVKHLPKKDREDFTRKHPKLDKDDVVVYYNGVGYKYKPLNKEWLKCVKNLDVAD